MTYDVSLPSSPGPSSPGPSSPDPSSPDPSVLGPSAEGSRRSSAWAFLKKRLKASAGRGGRLFSKSSAALSKDIPGEYMLADNTHPIPDDHDADEAEFFETEEMRHPLLEVDPELEEHLRACGLDEDQIQAVCDVLLERVLPWFETVMTESDIARQTERLVEHFGGEERWDAIRQQLTAWGTATLPKEAFEALAGSADGVMTLYRLMTQAEPALGQRGGASMMPVSEDDVRALMRDPRYWRDRDPTVVRRVRDGFQRLYPGER